MFLVLCESAKRFSIDGRFETGASTSISLMCTEPKATVKYYDVSTFSHSVSTVRVFFLTAMTDLFPARLAPRRKLRLPCSWTGGRKLGRARLQIVAATFWETYLGINGGIVCRKSPRWPTVRLRSKFNVFGCIVTFLHLTLKF